MTFYFVDVRMSERLTDQVSGPFETRAMAEQFALAMASKPQVTACWIREVDYAGGADE